MKYWAARYNGGFLSIVMGDNVTEATNRAGNKAKDQQFNLMFIKEATKEDIEWFLAMGGYIQDYEVIDMVK